MRYQISRLSADHLHADTWLAQTNGSRIESLRIVIKRLAWKNVAIEALKDQSLMERSPCKLHP
jgi:hypothetical protein